MILFGLRFLNIGRKRAYQNCTNACPDCNAALNRIRRRNTDKLIIHISFRLFDFKRYICNDCGWEGLRWEDKFRPNNT